jgi:transposase
MKLNKTKVRYILRQNRKGVATKEISRDVKVSQRTVQQIIKEFRDTGQEPVLGEKVGRPCKPYSELEAQTIQSAHARYRLGARMCGVLKLFRVHSGFIEFELFICFTARIVYGQLRNKLPAAFFA